MFLKTSQNSQENTCFGVSFLIKMQTCEFCEILRKAFFIEDHWWLLLHLLQIGAKLLGIGVALVIVDWGNGYKSGNPYQYNITVKPPHSGHPKQRTCFEYRTKCLVPNVAIFVKLPPNSGHLLIKNNFLRPVGVRYSEVSLHQKSGQLF